MNGPLYTVLPSTHHRCWVPEWGSELCTIRHNPSFCGGRATGDTCGVKAANVWSGCPWHWGADQSFNAVLLHESWGTAYNTRVVAQRTPVLRQCLARAVSKIWLMQRVGSRESRRCSRQGRRGRLQPAYIHAGVQEGAHLIHGGRSSRTACTQGDCIEV